MRARKGIRERWSKWVGPHGTSGKGKGDKGDGKGKGKWDQEFRRARARRPLATFPATQDMAGVAAESAATVLTVILPLYIGDGWCRVVWNHFMESSSSPMGMPHMDITAAGAYALTSTLT